MAYSVLGLDIGGANLKAAHSTGVARLQPFELWKNPAGLAEALQQLVHGLPDHDLLAVTMTGELCDCFESKRQGVQAILDAVEAVAERKPVRAWLADGRFTDLATARAALLEVAAANWLALATFAGRFVPSGPALLIDIGSTTTDIIPLDNGKPIPRGRCDPERLRCRELVYTGVRRTPVCAVLGIDGAAELFATMLDVYVLLGDLPEDAADHGTADGRLATKIAAHSRLARMLCGDGETCPAADTRQLAVEVRGRQVRCLRQALDQVAATLPGPPTAMVLAGAGEFLGRDVLKLQPGLAVQQVSLAEELGPVISEAACAYAVAILAAEQVTNGE